MIGADHHRLLQGQRDRHSSGKLMNFLCGSALGSFVIQHGFSASKVGWGVGRLPVLEVAAPLGRAAASREVTSIEISCEPIFYRCCGRVRCPAIPKAAIPPCGPPQRLLGRCFGFYLPLAQLAGQTLLLLLQIVWAGMTHCTRRLVARTRVRVEDDRYRRVAPYAICGVAWRMLGSPGACSCFKLV